MLPRAVGLVMALALLAGCQAREGSPALQAGPTAAPSTATAATSTTPVADTTGVAGITTTTTIAPPASVPAADLLNSAVTQATIGTTICVSGFTRTIRPPVSFTDPLKVHQIATYGLADKNVADYEEDHVIALEVGGAPATRANLFPEAHKFSVGDDTLENQLHAAVCGGRLLLAQAQQQLFAAKVAHGYLRAASIA